MAYRGFDAMKIDTENRKPRVAVHKFSSCDGCQLAFINAGTDLVRLYDLVEMVHFAEAGQLDEDAEVDVAFIEGSVSTPHEVERLQRIRKRSKFLITLGACATAGGLQALRNMADLDEYVTGVYASPEYITSLPLATPISQHVRVDLEIWGCPVNGRQVLAAVRSLLSGVVPVLERDKVCLECKRQQTVCVMVAKGEPCMGPVTRTGCGAICPQLGRDCYACFGPAEAVNTDSHAQHLVALGLSHEQVAQRFLFINNGAPEFNAEGLKWRDEG